MVSHRIPFETLSAERDRLVAENDRLRQQLRDRHRLSGLAGHSRAVRQVCELIDQVASSAWSVCLRGEPGVGKTRAARAIHCASVRSASPFVPVRCAAMPDPEVDVQLFGVGVSRAADAGGCVGRAAGGTLFFDEVAELGAAGQRRLLDLARGRATGRASIPDVRIIVSTSAALDELVEQGAFHADLRDHFKTLTIPMAPLRERREDLPVLTDLFVEQYAREHARGVSRVSERAADMLMNFDWPGNVSQLRKTVERAVALTTGHVIHHHHLPAEIQRVGPAEAAPPAGLSEALDAYEKELLEDALRQTGGVRSRAARLLMTSERVFSYRLRKHGIDSRLFRVA
jgi:Nif-specific regulatory protein